jgi:hypothetical protein
MYYVGVASFGQIWQINAGAEVYSILMRKWAMNGEDMPCANLKRPTILLHCSLYRYLTTGATTKLDQISVWFIFCCGQLRSVRLIELVFV